MTGSAAADVSKRLCSDLATRAACRFRIFLLIGRRNGKFGSPMRRIVGAIRRGVEWKIVNFADCAKKGDVNHRFCTFRAALLKRKRGAPRCSGRNRARLPR